MDNYGTTVTAIKYMTNALKVFYRRSFFDDVTNRDFGTPADDNPKTTKSIKRKYQQFKITTLYSNGWKTFTGSLSFSKIKEIISTLTIGTFLSLEDEVESLAEFKSSVEDPESTIVSQAGDNLKNELCKVIPGFYADVAAGNWFGTSYATGTVAVAVDTGVVTGNGTTFTASMVGKPFKAAGHSKWYRVKSYASATSITIEDDSDDQASAYTGGAISAGAAYEIQANAKVAITKTTIKQYLDDMGAKLDDCQVPDDGTRWLLLPTDAKKVLLAAPEVNADIERVHGEVVEKGLIAKASGFKIFFAPNSWFTGDNTNGYYVLGGHKSFITAGYGFIDPINIIPSKENQSGYGSLIKGLFGHGEKVADERRKAGVCMLATFSIS